MSSIQTESQNVPLVKAGEPGSIILVPGNASVVAWEAANELQRYIEKISGARIAIRTEKEFPRFAAAEVIGWQTPTLSHIFIGPCEATRRAGIDADSLPPEGYRIKTQDNALYLVGDDTVQEQRSSNTGEFASSEIRGYQMRKWAMQRRGTVFAVSSFLEQQLGVRWLWPGPLGEIVPKQRDIVIGSIDVADAPRLRMRRPGILYLNVRDPAGHFDNNLWFDDGNIHLKRFFMQSDEVFTRLACDLDEWIDRQKMGVSLMDRFAPWYGDWIEKYKDNHPEYFAVQPDGSRDASWSFPGAPRLCLSHPDVARLTAEEAIRWLDQSPGLMIAGLPFSDDPPHDFATHCVCENCLALGPTVTDRIVAFHHKVAERISRKYPDRYFGNYGGFNYAVNPPTVAKSHPNSVVYLQGGSNWSGYSAHGFDDTAREKTIAAWDGWAKTTKNMIWHTTHAKGNIYGLPMLYAHKMGEDLRHLYRSGSLMGIFVSLGRSWYWGACGLDYYLMAKLAWDPETDVDGLIDDYCQAGFGPAAAAIRRYFDSVEAHSNEIAAKRYSQRAPQAAADRLIRPHGGMPLYLRELYPKSIFVEWREFLEQGRADAGDDKEVSARIDFLREGLDSADLLIGAHDYACAVMEGFEPLDQAKMNRLFNAKWDWDQAHIGSQSVNVPRTHIGVEDAVGWKPPDLGSKEEVRC